MTIPDLALIEGCFADNWVAIEKCVKKIVHTHGVDPNLLYECIRHLVFDQVYDDHRHNFSKMNEDLSRLSEIKRYLTRLSLEFPHEFPNKFWEWHKTTVGIINADIKFTQTLMGSKKPQRGARKKLLRDMALKTIISHCKTVNVAKRIQDVAKLAILTDALNDGDKATAIESLNKIYYNKKIKPMTWK